MNTSLEQQFDFDQYGRYATVRRIVDANRKDNQRFRILDVGGRGNHLRKFLPHDDVFYLDPLVDQNEDENYIPGDGCDMPLPGSAFDFVVSLDTFEHIPQDKRSAFVSEHIRVARIGGILIAPFAGPGVEDAEKHANTFFETLTGEEHPWLTEHISYGLPRIEQVTSVAEAQNIPYTMYGNNAMSVWSLIAPLNFFLTTIGERIRPALEDWNKWYNTTIFPIDNDPHSYRKIFFLQKSPDAIAEPATTTPLTTEHFVAIAEQYLVLVGLFNQEKKAIEKSITDTAETVGVEYANALSVVADLEAAQKKLINDASGLKTYLANTLDHVQKLEDVIRSKDERIQWMERSLAWKTRNAVLRLKAFRPRHIKKYAKKAKSLAGRAVGIYKTKGLRTTLSYTLKYLRHGKNAFRPQQITATSYKEWIAHYEQYEIATVKKTIAGFNKKPLISVIVPVYNVDPQWLDACIQSVVDQWYENWELCLYDDASTNPETVAALRAWENKDSRIRIAFGAENKHICGASNQAIAMATGEYITLLDCDDAIAPFALYEFAQLLAEHPDTEFAYSDEDKITTKNERLYPFFKPGYSEELIRSLNFITHMAFIKKELGDSVGWFRESYEGAQDYDLFLRCISAITTPVRHIEKILYHWRMTETSTASDTSVKTYAHDAGENALRDYLTTKKEPFVAVEQGIGITNYHVRYPLPADALVSIIIPFKDKPELLKQCVDSILKKTTYQHYEIILISNNSVEPETAAYLKKISAEKRIQILTHDVPFNYSEINNWGAKHAKGDFLLLLNNDTEVITPNWIQEMLMHAARPEIGAVGAKLYYPDGSIQHAGVVLGMTGLAGHIFAREQSEQTYYRLAEFTNNYLAVTAACLMIEAKKYWEMGGLDENFTVCGNDVNLGLSLYEKGYRNVYTPFAELIHYESMTRDKTPPAHDFEVSKKRYAPYLNWNDPYYNKNLSLQDESVRLRGNNELTGPAI